MIDKTGWIFPINNVQIYESDSVLVYIWYEHIV